MSHYALRIPDSLFEIAKQRAEEDNVSIFCGRNCGEGIGGDARIVALK